MKDLINLLYLKAYEDLKKQISKKYERVFHFHITNNVLVIQDFSYTGYLILDLSQKTITLNISLLSLSNFDAITNKLSFDNMNDIYLMIEFYLANESFENV